MNVGRALILAARGRRPGGAVRARCRPRLPLDASCRRTCGARRSTTVPSCQPGTGRAGAAAQAGFGALRRHRRLRPRRSLAAGSRRPDGRVARPLSVHVRGDARRQHLRDQHAARLRAASSNGPIGRCSTPAWCFAPRSAITTTRRRSTTPFNMDGRRYYTYRESERRLAGMAGAGVRFFVLDSRSLDPDQLDWLRDAAGGIRHGVEDLLLPPSALHVRPLPRRRARPAPRARADPRRGRRRRRPLGPRAPLRTPPAPARHQLLHVGRGRIAAARRSDAVHRARQGVRHRLSLHADGGVGQRAVLPGDQPDGARRWMRGSFRGPGLRERASAVPSSSPNTDWSKSQSQLPRPRPTTVSVGQTGAQSWDVALGLETSG